MSNKNKETVDAPDLEQPTDAINKTTNATETKKTQPKSKTGTSVLRAIGLAACRRHNLAQAWVTSDGQTFAQESDAKAHAGNLSNKEILKVTP